MKSPLAVQAQQTGLADFLVCAGASYALLVDVVSAESPVARGLVASLVEGALPEQQGFLTELEAQTVPQASAQPRSSLAMLPAQWGDACCFALAVRRRQRDAFAGRVLLGRGNNQDIVLLDASVSRTHGWFESNARGRLVINDCGSANGILVNGARIKASHELLGGELLQFGRVRVAVLPLDRLWQLVRG